MSKEEHYNQIGWMINSFFLIFLGTILPVFMKKEYILNGLISSLVIVIAIFFGLISLRLFLRSQKRYKKEREREEFDNKKFFNSSIIVYILFMLLIEFFLLNVFYALTHLISIPILILTILILLLAFCLIIIETYKLNV